MASKNSTRGICLFANTRLRRMTFLQPDASAVSLESASQLSGCTLSGSGVSYLLMNRTTFPVVAALLAAFTLPNESFGQLVKNTNQSRKLGSVLVGGSGNLIGTNVTTAFIGGGQRNTAGNTATVGGGELNSATGTWSVVGGGTVNTASAQGAAVAGGGANNASTNYATVGGGAGNTASNYWSTVSGGFRNSALGDGATVGGGLENQVGGIRAMVGGGRYNTASGDYSAVPGGQTNSATASWATVGGGKGNTASGNYATVPGGAGGNATHIGSFVWSGDSTEGTDSFGNNTFTVRAEGGVRFYTADGIGSGVFLGPGDGAWNILSDREAKANFQKVNATDVLAKVAAMPVMTWNYRTQNESVRHIGPTAQDFRAAFGLGESDKTISTIDPSGVALAAIQGLVEELKERDKAMTERDEKIGKLETELRAIRERLADLPPQ